MKKNETIKVLCKILSAFSSPTRHKIVKFILEEDREKATFAEITEMFKANPRSVLFHLEKLIKANIVC